MTRNEKTHKEIAKIAGHIMKLLAKWPHGGAISTAEFQVCTVGELRALAASALTQAPDKKVKAR